MRETEGNLLTSLTEGIIAHGCNALGVMGAGFAKQVKQRHPEAFRAYKRHEREHGLALGSVSFAQVGSRLWIANMVTQATIRPARGQSLADLGAIERGFAQVGARARELGLDVEFPMVGCGLAGGEWSEVRPRIEAGLGEGVASRLWLWSPASRPARAHGKPR